MGSTQEEVIAAYGEPDRRSDLKHTPGGVHILYKPKGMVIGLQDDKVHYMSFQTPRAPQP